MTVSFNESVPCGTVTAPPSKSFAHRAIICGAFSQKSTIKNIAYSDDINASLSCIESLGARVERGEDFVTVYGLDNGKVKNGTELFCNESGSTLRFLIPICLLFNKEITLKGAKRLLERPLDEYEKLFSNNGFLFSKDNNGIKVCGKLTAGEYSVSGEISSQYVTGLILALSFTEGKSILKVTGKPESKPYIDITLSVLKTFGIDIAEENENEYTVIGKSRIKGNEYTVEADCSNGAYLEAFSFIGNGVDVYGIEENSVQGDRVFRQMFTEFKNGKKEFDLSDCPDLAPVMFSIAALYGYGKFLGTKRLKYKESDRSLAMKEELLKFGAQTEIFDNEVIIKADSLKTPDEKLSSHNDHRIVMALSLLSAKYGGVIEGAEAVNKSFPDFFEKIKDFNVGIEII